MPPGAPAPAPAPPVTDPALVVPLEAPQPAPGDAPAVDMIVSTANWHADVPLQPVPGDPALPPVPAPASEVVAAPAPDDPLAPVAGVSVPAPATGLANPGTAGDVPPPAGTPHLASPENLPPGTTVDPSAVGNSSPNVSYLNDIWHAIQTQDVSGKGALLALTQRPLTTPDTPGGQSPTLPAPAAVDPAAPSAPLPAPVPLLPPA
jgi:resuscitation-promoting factor RpfA